MRTSLQTISAYKSLLKEDDYQLKEAGLSTLLQHVGLHWSDIANDIADIQNLLVDPKFPNQPLAAILLARLYFHLNDYKEALNFALQAGTYFNVDEQSEFTEVLVNKCIEDYIALSKQRRNNPSVKDNPRFKEIVSRMVEYSLTKGEYRQPLGIAIETQDMELVRRVLGLMNYHEVVDFVLPHLDVVDPEFRTLLLREVASRDRVDKARATATPYQYINILILLKYLDDFNTVSSIIYDCLKDGQKEIGYTLALEVSEMHSFAQKVLSAIPIEPQFEAERNAAKYILEGRLKDDVHNSFLKANTKTDPHYQTLLKGIDPKNSVAHSSALLSLSLLQAYTQDDSFVKIKENFEWAAKCTHWAKFSSIASLGLIHRNVKNNEMFKQFLPEANKPGIVNHYPNGGALYGLGLVFTGTRDENMQAYYTNITTNPDHNQNEVVMHGACLGLGLTAFASSNQAIYDRLKDFLSISNSIIGEAAALSIGLVYAGSNDQTVIADLINTAEESDHEKIIRSVCLAIAIVGFQSPSSEVLANIEKNPTLKLAVPQYIASAYFKSSNQEAVRKLLHLSNDISNEVKRTSITALGFVMYHDDHLIDIIKMMIYSYNPFIRYGCAMALMIGAKDSRDAVELIWPLLTDSVDYVRQSAYVSISILLQATNANSEPRLAEFRKILGEVIAKKHEEPLAKMGAILAIGLLDIGGRNMTVALTTRSGIPKIEAIVGMMVFLNFWNWFPYINFIGLALTPSAFIGVTTDFKIPKSFQLRSNCKATLFDYPANIVKEQKKELGKRETKVQLSTTIKARARANNKKKESEMDIEPGLHGQPSLISQVSNSEIPLKDSKEEESKEEKPKEEKKQEPTFSILKNPTRIAEKQRKYISFVEGRYSPILVQRKIGISFLKDSTPGKPDEYLNEISKPQLPVVRQEGAAPVANTGESSGVAMPEEFEFKQ